MALASMRFWNWLSKLFRSKGEVIKEDTDWLFTDGISNTEVAFGFSAGTDPDPKRVEEAARILGRAIRFVDEDGFEREIFAAAVCERSGLVAYVETKAKQLSDRVDIKIHLHIREKGGREVVWEIVSYNPFFGCNVRFMEWFGDTILIIYREKHSTYVCRLGLDFPANCKRIGDYWLIHGAVLASRHNYKELATRRLSIPDLAELPDFPKAEAEKAGEFPTIASPLPTRFWRNK
jgi:hypothetical protein